MVCAADLADNRSWVRPALVPRHIAIHRQSIRPSTRFKRLPVWVSKADIFSSIKLSATDAQAPFDSAPRQRLISPELV